MATDRRTFLQQTALGIAAGAAGAATATAAAASPSKGADASGLNISGLARQGVKEVVSGKRAVASSQHPIVTRTMLDTLKAGGNAMDAVIAGSITQATVQPEMTNHTGTVSCLYWDAKSSKVHHLNSMGVLHPTLPPFRMYPPGVGGVAAGSPMACMPGFMPGMKAMHEKFGSRPWKSLVEPAIPHAEDGYVMDEFARAVLEYELTGNLYFPDMRALYAPNGFTPSVGEKVRNPALGKTLRGLADEGPDYFITGGWARDFVKLANELGWAIKIEDLSATPARWNEPLVWKHNGYEIAQPPPPERNAVYCAMVLGILRHVEVAKLGHYSESAESLYYMAQALRRAHYETGHLNDPQFFESPQDVWLSDDYLASLATIIKKSMPKSGVDLTKHVQLTTNPAQLRAFGWAPAAADPKPKQPSGSCELTCVDANGNWAQMMNTLQSGGIPGMMVGGVPMIGSHVQFSMDAAIAGWLGVPGSRMRSVMSNVIVLRDGKPVHSLGSPGNVHCTVPQMISNVLDYSYTPYEAAVLPRMLPMRDDLTIEIETRLPEKVVRDLARLGAKASPLPTYDFHMGSYQQAWRQPDGRLAASTDPRRAGKAEGM